MTVFVIGDERHHLDLPRDIPFTEIEAAVRCDLNLYCDFVVWAGTSVVDCCMTLIDLDNFVEFRIERPARPSDSSGWIVDFSPFEIVHRFDRRSRFSVAVASDATRRLSIVVKEFPSPCDDEDFAREFDALTALDHPCIVPLFGCALRTEKQFPKLATYLMAGGSLSDVLRERPPWLDRTAKTIILVGMVMGMAFMHSKGLVHRALRPASIVLDEGHRPRICDFGTCTSRASTSTLTLSGRAIGTPLYAAPELFVEVQYSEKVDVYSFVLMLFEIVVGVPVFQPGITLFQLARKLEMDERPDIPEKVPPRTRDLIASGWSKDPNRRPSFAEIFEVMKECRYRLIDEHIDSSAIDGYVEWVRKCDRA
jgi:serine/threonine protein kinase